MNWRAIPPALLWFTLLGPLLVTVLAVLGSLVNVMDLGDSLDGNGLLLLIALPYAYMLFGPTCVLAGLIFGVARGLSSPWLATQPGALIMGAAAGAFAGAGAVSSVEFGEQPALATSTVVGMALGVIVGALCGLFTHYRETRARRVGNHGADPST